MFQCVLRNCLEVDGRQQEDLPVQEPQMFITKDAEEITGYTRASANSLQRSLYDESALTASHAVISTAKVQDWIPAPLRKDPHGLPHCE